MKRHRRSRASGFSLLEAILATGIFIAAMAVLGQLIDMGLVATRANERATVGQLRCESKMEEIIAGIQPVLSLDSKTRFPDDPSWQWSLETETNDIAGLLQVTVIVEHQLGEEEPDFEFRLSRWMPQPPVLGTEPPEGPLTAITIPEMLGIAQAPAPSPGSSPNASTPPSGPTGGQR